MPAVVCQIWPLTSQVLKTTAWAFATLEKNGSQLLEAVMHVAVCKIWPPNLEDLAITAWAPATLEVNKSQPGGGDTCCGLPDLAAQLAEDFRCRAFAMVEANRLSAAGGGDTCRGL